MQSGESFDRMGMMHKLHPRSLGGTIMNDINKAAANASVPPEKPNKIEGGKEMEKLISTSTNNIALNATSDTELQSALKESLKIPPEMEKYIND